MVGSVIGNALYLGPAAGGDIYILCLPPATARPTVGPFASLTITDAFGDNVVDVELGMYTEKASVDGNSNIDQLTVRLQNGRTFVHGLYMYAPAVPFYVPHDRPVGTWSFAYETSDTTYQNTFQMRAPCHGINSSPAHPPHPLDWASNFEYYSSWEYEHPLTQSVLVRLSPENGLQPPRFEHCRIFPDVRGMRIEDAIAVIETYGLANDIEMSFQVRPGSVVPKCPDGIVDEAGGQQPAAYTIGQYSEIRYMQSLPALALTVFLMDGHFSLGIDDCG